MKQPVLGVTLTAIEQAEQQLGVIFPERLKLDMAKLLTWHRYKCDSAFMCKPITSSLLLTI